MGSACGTLGSISSSASRAGPSERGLAAWARRAASSGAGCVVCRQPQPSDGSPGCRAGGGVGEVFAQRLLHHGGGQFLVAHPGVSARDAGQGGIALLGVGQRDVRFQGFGAVGHAIQRDQDLQNVTVGLARRGMRLLPGPCRLQRRVARARLEREFHGALVKRRVVGLARGIEHQRVARRRLRAPGVEFAQQQLVEKLGIQRRGLQAWAQARAIRFPPAGCSGGLAHRPAWARASTMALAAKGNRFIEP